MRKRIRSARGLGRANRQGLPLYEAAPLERRLLLAAIVAPADPIIYDTSVSGPLAPQPGHSFYVAGFNSQGTALSRLDPEPNPRRDTARDFCHGLLWT